MASDIHDTLGLTPGGRRKRIGRWIIAALVIVALAVVLIRMRAAPAQAASPYKTETVQQGALTVSVTATGELKPVTQVNIGTEISGIVESVDVDFNSTVTVGQTLARVNTEKLEAQAAQARAGLRSAEAKQLQAEATVAEAEAELARLQHVRELSGGRVPSKQEMDSQEATVKRAHADQASSAAQVAQSQASLTAIDTDIRKAIIRSPISGIVLDRQVDPGQTVAASFQTPTLFTLAQDLTKMKLIVDVDEADIGNVRVRTNSKLPCRRVPGSIVLIEGQRSPQHAENVEWRRDLSNGARRRQLRATAPAGNDGNGGNHGHARRGCPAGPECGAQIHAAGRAAGTRRWRLPPAATTAGSAAARSLARGWPVARVADVR